MDSAPALEAALGACLIDAGFLLEDLRKRSDKDIRSWRELFVWEQVEPALPRFVWYLLILREDTTAQQLHQLFSEMLGKRAGEVVGTEAEVTEVGQSYFTRNSVSGSCLPFT